ncbi:MAG: MBOAT family protein [Lachnospiraceae bacterium]|nr:MBOAT family protein [Lachnospiraceae bacterium]
MLFNSIDFFIFFPIVVLLYFIIPKKVRYIWLLISSYYFYMCWNAKYAILIAISTIITWISGLLIEKSKTVRGKKGVVAMSFISNLGILFVFKYFDFALANINRILAVVNVELISNPFDIILPVGISFYTFQALGYTMDVYRGELKAEKNPLRYALFVSFFPQLVAGPIERSKNLLTQLKKIDTEKMWNYDKAAEGVILIFWGLFMKMVIADRIAIFVNQIFLNIYAYGTIELILGAVAFAIQIYCDFNGYSTIAIGAAKVMGFELMENFKVPYFSTSIKEFWRRWHISLSSWFKDYLYIPLGGNRCGRIRKYCNLMITFLVSGLWHGAAWTYVIWGGLHGVYQIAGDVLSPVRSKVIKWLRVDTSAFSYKFGQMAITFALTTFAWIFFRAGSIDQAIYYIQRLFTKWNPWVLFDQSLYNIGLDVIEMNVLMIALLCLVIVDLLKYKKDISVAGFLMKQNLWFRWAVLLFFILAVLVYGKYGINFDSSKFIYFDF